MVCRKRSVQGSRLEVEKNGPSYPPIDIFTFDYNKLKLEDDMKISSNEKACTIYKKTVCVNVTICHHLKRGTFSDMVWKVFKSLMNLTNERNKKLNFFTDPILIKINCNQKLSLNKMTYFNVLVFHFDKVYDIDSGGKIRFVVDAYVCSSKIMLAV